MPSSRRRFLTVVAPGVAGSLGPRALAGVGESGFGSGSGSEADWPMARYDPAGTAAHPTAAGPKDGVRVAWGRETPTVARGFSPPIRVAETLFVAQGGLFAYDCRTGRQQFQHTGAYNSTPAVVAAPIYTTDTLAVTGAEGVYGLNAGGGVELPLLNRTVGGQRWANTKSPGGGFFGPPDPVSPVAAGGTIYTPIPGTNDVVALNPNNGQVRWRNTVGPDESGSVEFQRPAVRDSQVFVTNWPAQATAFDAETGRQHWQRELDELMTLAPVATEAGVVVQTRKGVRLLDSTDGTTRWRRVLDGNATEGAPAVAGERVFVADGADSLHAVDLRGGETLWTVPFGREAAPVVADGVVYVVGNGHSLLALDAESGEQRFEYEPERAPISTPVVGNGTLHVATWRGVLALEGAA